MTPTFRIAVIAGDGIGRKSCPRACACCEAAARALRLCALEFTPFRMGALRLLPAARPDDAGRLEGAAAGHGRDLLRRGRLARHGAGPHFAVGFTAEVPPRVRPVHQPATGAPVRRRALPAGRAQAGRHRLLRGAREHRGRIHRAGRRDVRGHAIARS